MPLVASTGANEALDFLQAMWPQNPRLREFKDPQADQSLKQVWLFGVVGSHRHYGTDLNSMGSIRVIKEGSLRAVACRTSKLVAFVKNVNPEGAGDLKMESLRFSSSA